MRKKEKEEENKLVLHIDMSAAFKLAGRYTSRKNRNHNRPCETHGLQTLTWSTFVFLFACFLIN